MPANPVGPVLEPAAQDLVEATAKPSYLFDLGPIEGRKVLDDPQFGEGYYLRRDGMMWFWDQYITSQQQRNEITASPLHATLGQLAGLPPALVITAEADVLRDEGEAYASKLRQAGVPVTAVRYEGIVRDFVTLNSLRLTRAADATVLQASATLARALTKA